MSRKFRKHTLEGAVGEGVKAVGVSGAGLGVGAGVVERAVGKGVAVSGAGLGVVERVGGSGEAAWEGDWGVGGKGVGSAVVGREGGWVEVDLGEGFVGVGGVEAGWGAVDSGAVGVGLEGEAWVGEGVGLGVEGWEGADYRSEQVKYQREFKSFLFPLENYLLLNSTVIDRLHTVSYGLHTLHCTAICVSYTRALWILSKGIVHHPDDPWRNLNLPMCLLSHMNTAELVA